MYKYEGYKRRFGIGRTVKADNVKNDKDRLISVRDIILLCSVLLLCTCIFLLMLTHGKKGFKVSITVDGEVVKEMELFTDEEYCLQTDKGLNKIIVKDGSVSVAEADCPDKVCVNHKPISDKGETIICLPHRMVIEIED